MFREKTISLKLFLARSGRLSPYLCLEMCRQLATIISEIHGRGTIMGNLDASNVYVREEPDSKVRTHLKRVFGFFNMSDTGG